MTSFALLYRRHCLQKATGDFASVLYQTIGSRSSVAEGTLTIDELNLLLDSLSKSFRVSAKLPERK
jgi:hypothetical protein